MFAIPNLKTIVHGLIILAVLVAGGAAGFKLSRIGEPQRIARAAKPLCDAAVAKATERQLRLALRVSQQTLVLRAAAVAEQEQRATQLESEKQEALNATPDLDRIVVGADEPWVQRVQPVPRRRPAHKP